MDESDIRRLLEERGVDFSSTFGSLSPEELASFVRAAANPLPKGPHVTVRVDPLAPCPCPCCARRPNVRLLEHGGVIVECLWCENGMFAKDREDALECWNYFCHGHV